MSPSWKPESQKRWLSFYRDFNKYLKASLPRHHKIVTEAVTAFMKLKPAAGIITDQAGVNNEML